MRRMTAGLMALVVCCAALNTGDSEAGWRKRARRACCEPTCCAALPTSPPGNYFCNGGPMMPGSPVMYAGTCCNVDCTNSVLCTCTGSTDSCGLYPHSCAGGDAGVSGCNDLSKGESSRRLAKDRWPITNYGHIHYVGEDARLSAVNVYANDAAEDAVLPPFATIQRRFFVQFTPTVGSDPHPNLTPVTARILLIQLWDRTSVAVGYEVDPNSVDPQQQTIFTTNNSNLSVAEPDGKFKFLKVATFRGFDYSIVTTR